MLWWRLGAGAASDFFSVVVFSVFFADGSCSGELAGDSGWLTLGLIILLPAVFLASCAGPPCFSSAGGVCVLLSFRMRDDLRSPLSSWTLCWCSCNQSYSAVSLSGVVWLTLVLTMVAGVGM